MGNTLGQGSSPRSEMVSKCILGDNGEKDTPPGRTRR